MSEQQPASGADREEVPTDVITIRKPGRAFRVIAMTLGTIIVATGLLAAGFFLGQSTRKSDEQVARERAVAVRVAVERKGAEDKQLRIRMMERQEAKLKARHRSVIRRVVRKLKKSGDRRAQQAFASGNASGFSSGRQQGFDDGVDEGIERASDEVVCSDDPDVPLPYCN